MPEYEYDATVTVRVRVNAADRDAAAEQADEAIWNMIDTPDIEVMDVNDGETRQVGDDGGYYDDYKYDLWKEEQPDPREYDV